MEAIQRLTSPCVPLLRDHVDTDQIFPARFLTTTERTGMGQHLFFDLRRGNGGPEAPFILDRPTMHGRRILVSGENFGTGSSREHAVWALMDFGFRAIIARSFADIFYSNALKNGLLPITLAQSAHDDLIAALEADASVAVTIDLAATAVTLPSGGFATFHVDPFTKRLLLDGVDEMDYLLTQREAIEEFERRHPAAIDTRAFPE
ncbi:MAG: 3-isopropylmalate dehydratase small subunit [Candidatus Dormibacter sp.]